MTIQSPLQIIGRDKIGVSNLLSDAVKKGIKLNGFNLTFTEIENSKFKLVKYDNASKSVGDKKRPVRKLNRITEEPIEDYSSCAMAAIPIFESGVSRGTKDSNKSTVWQCAKGRCPSAYDFKWKFI